jgi:lysophospholipase L1-like esterase
VFHGIKPFILIIFLLVSLTSLFAQTRERSEHWHNRIQQFEVEMSSMGEVDLVFLGNSITEGFDLSHYFPEYKTANRGIVADHMDGLMERLDNSALALQPKKLFLMIGINDIGDKRDDKYLKAMFVTLVDTLITSLPETDIYLLSLLPTTPRWKNCPPDQIKRINGFLAELALEKGVVFVNLYPYFLGDMHYLNQDLTRDGLHPNQAGYDLMARKIKPFLTASE